MKFAVVVTLPSGNGVTGPKVFVANSRDDAVFTAGKVAQAAYESALEYVGPVTGAKSPSLVSVTEVL